MEKRIVEHHSKQKHPSRTQIAQYVANFRRRFKGKATKGQKRFAEYLQQVGTHSTTLPYITALPHTVWKYKGQTFLQFDDMPNVPMVVHEKLLAAERVPQLTLVEFVRDKCELNVNARTTTTNLYHAYLVYCQKADQPGYLIRQFSKFLFWYFPQVERKRIRINGKLTYVYTGIQLKDGEGNETQS